MTWLARFAARQPHELHALRHDASDHHERLDAHLRDSARQPHHGLPAFRTAVTSDPDFAATVRKHLAEIDSDPLCERCWITSRTRDHLRHALS